MILDQRRGRVPQGTQPTVFVSFIDGAADFGDNGWMAIQPSARAAVADTAGTGTLRYARETLNTGGAFLSDLALQGFGELAAEAVRTVRLDDLPLKRPVRLVKMDVEGAEPKVIAGARELIAADRPIVISEVHPEQLARVSASTPAALFDQLGACGLRPHGSVDGRLGPRVDAAAIAGVTLAFVLPS